MSRLELRIPPDAVWLAVAGLMWLTSEAMARVAIGETSRRVAALTLIVIGTVLIVASRRALSRAGTTWHPTEPGRSSVLVTTGVYRLTRNPTYVGMEVVLLSLAVILASPAAALVSGLFVAYIDRFQVRPEELTLDVLFGQDYRDYALRVRRWI